MPKPSLYARRSSPFTWAVAVVVACAVVSSAAAQPAERPPCAACVVLVTTPGQSIVVSEPLNDIEVLVRMTAGRSTAETSAIRQAMQVIRAAGGRPGLFIAGTAGAPDISGIVELAVRIVVDIRNETGNADELAFRVKSRFTELRAANPQVLLGLFGQPESLMALARRDVTPYVDFFARSGPGPSPTVSLAIPSPLASVHPAQTEAAAATIATADRWLVELPADVVEAARVLGDVARAAPLLRDGLISGGAVDIRCGDQRSATYLDPESLDTIAVVRACRSAIVSSPAGEETARVVLSTGDVLIRIRAAEGRFAEGVDVRGARELSVREIIARHQAAAARQRRAVHHVISTGAMTLAFEAPGFSAPIAITTKAVLYTAPDRVEIEQRDIRVNGIAFPGGGIPRLPLLEPERVASPPLAISLTDVYTYSLAGVDNVDGTHCYVVAFKPVEQDRSLYAGRVWIGRDSFAMVRISAVQTRLRGPIVSSEQTDDFRLQGSAWLLARSEVRQLYEGAGYRTPIHRVLAIEQHDINPRAFEARRQAAYASSSIMLRDTVDGFRYLKREPVEAKEGVTPAVVPTLAGPSQRVRTIAVGVIVDPNISRPLPFAGLSYVDFNLFGTGTQFNGFFGGTYGQLAMSVPSLGGTRWQLGGRAFGIATSYNDRAFVNGRELYEANISQRPAHASVWLLRPLTPRITARGGYELDYTDFGRASSTSSSFVVPAAQVAHALRLGIEGQWGGWSGSAWWAAARRAGWRQWGDSSPAAPRVAVAEYEPRHGDYQRTGVTLSRSIVVSPKLVGRVEAAWMTGRDLDRFSRYTFGSFDNRLRGYPSALIRYDRGGVLRGSAAWAAGRLLRLDGFADAAFVHDPGFGERVRDYSGLGAAAEVPAPFGTLVAIEWGYGFQGLNSNGSKGTQVLRITGYKIF
jgi:hypothetical protein